ncbi:MAG: hypothetical protein GY757_03830 [bacterium]|nr:hypothetical protein [bacterium]
MSISGNYDYVGDEDKNVLHIIDISGPPPSSAYDYETELNIEELYAKDGYLFASAPQNVVYVFDVSSISSITEVARITEEENLPGKLYASGNYLYIHYTQGKMYIYDISDISAPEKVSTYNMYNRLYNMRIAGELAFFWNLTNRIYIVNISQPTAPKYLGTYSTRTARGLEIYHFSETETPSLVSLDRNQLNFSTVSGGATTPAQSVHVANAGQGTLEWSVNSEIDNPFEIQYTPEGSTGSAELNVAPDTTTTAELEPGVYEAKLTVTNDVYGFDSQMITINLRVYEPTETTKPFGEFATPLEGTTISNSVPFTGWGLDDVAIETVKIYLEYEGNSLYIGKAIQVEGARPDIQNAYPTYPMNHKAGWGYMMLTYFLPGGGNGTYTFHAKATDLEGNEVILGTKTVTIANNSAVKPFGAMDLPDQGGTASGEAYLNKGWVLATPGNSIPTDGTTIRLYVDGQQLENAATYNIPRSDIATLFPENQNSAAAGVRFQLDTTAYENGVHTISWTAVDNAGNSDGIGSRYFTNQNAQNRVLTQHDLYRPSRGTNRKGSTIHRPVTVEREHPVTVKTGTDPKRKTKTLYPGENGVVLIKTKELEPMEILLMPMTRANIGMEGVEALAPLPVGATLDKKRGIFYWGPGVGYVGDYTISLLIRTTDDRLIRRQMRIHIMPKFEPESNDNTR